MPTEPIKQHRALSIGARSDNSTRPEYAVSISSEAPVCRYDYITGRYYDEILSHAPGAIDLSRADRGLPLITDHTPTVTNTVGRVMDLQIRPDQKLAGRMLLSSNQRGLEIANDIDAGILGDTSIGYECLEWEDQATNDPAEPFQRTITRWRPYEVTLTPIPADTTVGTNRSQPTPSKERPVIDSIEEQPQHERALQISQMIEMSGVRSLGVSDVLAYTGSGKTISEIGRDLLARKIAQSGRPSPSPVTLDTNHRDFPQVSLQDGLRSLDPQYRGALGHVREYTEEQARQGITTTSGRFSYNLFANQTRAVTTNTVGAGQEAIFNQYQGTLDVLRPIQRMQDLGISMHFGQRENPSWLDVPTGVTIFWTGEAPGSAVTNSQVTTQLRTASPKTAQAATVMSRNFLTQSSDAGLVERDMRAAVAAEMERVTFYGSGTSNQPGGIGVAAGTQLVSIGTNGGQMTMAKVLEGLSNLATKNVETENIRGVFTPAIAYSMANIPRFVNTDSRTLWDLDQGAILGRPAFQSNNLPSTLTKGSSSVCHAGILGDFSAAHVYQYGQTEFFYDPYTLGRQGQTYLIAFFMMDVLLTRPSWFSVYRDLLP